MTTAISTPAALWPSRRAAPCSASSAPPAVATSTTSSVRTVEGSATSVCQCAAPKRASAKKAARRSGSVSERVVATRDEGTAATSPPIAPASAGRGRTGLMPPLSRAARRAGAVDQLPGAAGDGEGRHAGRGSGDGVTTKRAAAGRCLSARGARLRSAPVTHRTEPARGSSAPPWGALPASTSASRACSAGQEPRSRRDVDRPPLARQQQRAAALARQVHAQRRGRAHGHVERLLAGRRAGVEHDQRRGVEVGDQSPLDHLAGASDRRPVDARRWRALAIRAQAVDLELRGRGVEAPAADADVPAAAGTGDAAARTVAAGRDHRLDARQHEHLFPLAADDLALVQDAADRGSRAAPARAGAARDARSARRCAAAAPSAPRSAPSGRAAARSAPRRAGAALPSAPGSAAGTAPPRARCAGPSWRVRRAPRAASSTQTAAATPSTSSATPGT